MFQEIVSRFSKIDFECTRHLMKGTYNSSWNLFISPWNIFWLHIQEILLQENYSREKLIQISFTKILQKENGIRAYYPKPPSRTNSHPNLNPKKGKEQPAATATCKRGEQRGMSEQRSVHSNAITIRMSCTPMLMQFQALIKFVILSRSKQPLFSVLETGNTGALRLRTTNP